MNTGKTFSGSKVRVAWRFGWSEGEDHREHEVVLVHSLVSGKKTITEDGKMVVQVSHMQRDFAHGWNSESYVFRVEIGTPSAADSGGYVFSIDGVRFTDMLRKTDVARSVGAAKSSSSSSAGTNNRAQFQSPTETKKPAVKVNVNAAGRGEASGGPNRAAAAAAASQFDPFAADDSFGNDTDGESLSHPFAPLSVWSRHGHVCFPCHQTPSRRPPAGTRRRAVAVRIFWHPTNAT